MSKRLFSTWQGEFLDNQDKAYSGWSKLNGGSNG
jgi:hypothetical protein